MRKSKRLVPVLLILILLFSVAAKSSCQDSTVSSDAYEKPIEVARAAVWKDITSGKAGSASVAISDNGEIVYSEGFGMANREKSTPVNNRTLFNMGSVSKTFCSTAVMLLVDDGKVELDTPVVQYLPEFTMADPRYKDITVRMLLNHTSGLPGTSYANNFGYEYNSSIYEDTLANLSNSYLKAAPGETAPYCNDGFTLAEMLVARVSGSSYIDFLSDMVLHPLSLSRTGASVGERSNKDYSAFYQPDTAIKLPPEVLSILGAGGLSSTAENLVSFADSFSANGKKVLSESAIAEMTKAQPSVFAGTAEGEAGINPEMAYGLGFDLTDVSSYREIGIKVIGKGGDTDYYHSMMLSVPDSGLSVAVMEAGNGSSAPEIAFEILHSILEDKGLLEKEEAPVTKPPGPQNTPPEYQAFDGYYVAGSSYRISFDFAENTANLATLENGVEGNSIALAYRDGFFYSESGALFKFISVDGRSYLLAAAFGNPVYMIMGERLPVPGEPQALGIDINGRQWLRRNVKPFEGMSLATSHVVASSTVAAMPGYVDFLGFKRIESPDSAGMASAAVRDLTELTLLDKDGRTWARVSDMLYSPSDLAVALRNGENAVTIGNDGYNEWLRADEDLILVFDQPEKGRVIVFSPDGSQTYDSVIDKGAVYVPQGSLVELAGLPGDAFKVTATTP